jgi:hypothetical protein
MNGEGASASTVDSSNGAPPPAEQEPGQSYEGKGKGKAAQVDDAPDDDDGQ